MGVFPLKLEKPSIHLCFTLDDTQLQSIYKIYHLDFFTATLYLFIKQVD
jgi:chloramphenicol O-acetyltransferase